MKLQGLIFLLFFPFFLLQLHCQPLVFKENAKWGIKENDVPLIKPVYDSVFNFSVSGKVCLACHKTWGASTNKFIKTLTKIYYCNYLDRSGKRLSVMAEGKDTCSVFVLGKHTVKQFSESPDYFIVSIKSRKHLVDKNFRQITFKGYHDLLYTPEPGFMIAQAIDQANTISWGLINMNEEVIIPFEYSDIRINPDDSLIAACSAGIRPNSEDDVFNYQGKKVGAYRRHVDLATKNFIIHKIYEPKEYYILYNIEKKEEKILNAEEVKFYRHDEILVRIKSDWYIYNLVTNEKKASKQS